MSTSTLLPMPTEHAVDVFHQPTLPSIPEMRQRMAWMADFRKLLVEYVEQQMDPSRHMYTFAGNRYTRVKDRAAIQALLARGEKPALNQEGMHNLLALYEADIDDQRIEETREDGHYTCRVTLWFRYWGGRRVMGVGSATTRESKYAYRWVHERDVPQGVDKGALKSRTYEPEGGGRPNTRYRLENDDLADIEATVLQIGFKRAKSSAVKSLPGVSEMFGTIGDPDELQHEADPEREALLATLQRWLRSLRAAIQPKALLAVFGTGVRANDVPKLETARLKEAASIVDIATRGGINWASVTVNADLEKLLAASAQQAHQELYGATGPGTEPPPPATSGTQTNGPWRDNVQRLASMLPDALTEDADAALATRVHDTCEQALRLAEDATTSLSAGEAMLEALRKLSDEVAGQVTTPPAQARRHREDDART